MAFKQVTIIGTGLIGGSLGLALKKRQLAGRIVGCDRAPVLERAQDCGAIEAGSPHPAETMGARIAVVEASEHDRFCAWISHLPQMISTALAATLVDEFGPDAPVLDIGGRALREMTRISGSPYSMWRDIAITNKKNIADVLQKLEQRLARIREKLDSKQLADEFERAHRLRKSPPRRNKGTEESNG